MGSTSILLTTRSYASAIGNARFSAIARARFNFSAGSRAAFCASFKGSFGTNYSTHASPLHRMCLLHHCAHHPSPNLLHLTPPKASYLLPHSQLHSSSLVPHPATPNPHRRLLLRSCGVRGRAARVRIRSEAHPGRLPPAPLPSTSRLLQTQKPPLLRGQRIQLGGSAVPVRNHVAWVGHVHVEVGKGGPS